MRLLIKGLARGCEWRMGMPHSVAVATYKTNLHAPRQLAQYRVRVEQW